MPILSTVLFFIVVFQVVYFLYLMREKRNAMESYIIQDLYSFEEETVTKKEKGAFNIIKRVLKKFNKKFFEQGKIKRRIEKQLIKLGGQSHLRPGDILVFKEIAVVGGCIAAFLLYKKGITNPLILIGAVILSFFVPDYFLSKKIKDRETDIRISLPGVVDLLTLCVEAGMDFMSAFEKIITKQKGAKKDPFVEEINVMLGEIRIGLTRRDALKNMAKRIEIPEISAFISVLLQTEELGTDLVNIMRDYAVEIRIKRLQMAEKRAAQIGTKMIFPMILFIFPMTFVIILVPLILNYFMGKT
ncbi:type II secretion system F family protein [bacterium]|nr:type II secretion system F family protein [bacterium]